MHCVGEGVRDLELGLPGFGFQLCSVTCLVFHSFFFFHLMVDLFYSSMCWWVRTVHTEYCNVHEVHMYRGFHRVSDVNNNLNWFNLPNSEHTPRLESVCYLLLWPSLSCAKY